MANTTNFGWETPDDTDLVKDGAAAMRTLGNAIDASLVDLKGGTTNQILAKNSNTDMDFKWVTNDVGDITAVTAGTGLSGGGTSGDVTLTNTVATTFDAKGDLVVGTGADTFAKLVAGSNGDTLVADSSTTTGLRWQADWNTGKNKIINGDFYINQRGFTSHTSNAFCFDRWQSFLVGGTSTISAQSFTPGTAPVAGYEGKSFLRMASTGQSAAGDRTSVFQYIEDCRTFAGQTVTISFWAKASTGTPNVSVEFFRNYGTGGSPSSAESIGNAKIAITSSWARYSATLSVASLSGKTLGTTDQGFLGLGLWTSAGTNFNSRTDSLGIQSVTIDWWGIQVEAGSVATPFTTATGTLAGEFALAQRYYEILTRNEWTAIGSATSTTATVTPFVFRVTKRVAPTMTVATAGTGNGQVSSLTSAGALPATAGTSSSGAITVDGFQFLISGASASYTAGQGLGLYANGSTTIWTASAEL